MLEGGSRSDERYLSQYPTVTSSVSSSASQSSSFETSVWQQYRYYHNQFYRHPQYLPQYPHHYPADTPSYHSASWLHPHSRQYHSSQQQEPQLHLADSVGITPAYHSFREMNGICSYDSVY